jgi:hypothetical protein
MKEKMDLAAQMMDQKLFPTDFIYDHLFHMSEDQYDEYRDLIREDSKRKFRITQIENEGNDPLETGKSYGTPHDLATLYGKERMYSQPNTVPKGYNTDEKKPLGRPEEKVSGRNTQDNAFGKDRIGSIGMKKDNDSSDSIKPQYKGGSPLSLKEKTMLKKMDNEKRIIFEKDENKGSLLDENQIRE